MALQCQSGAPSVGMLLIVCLICSELCRNCCGCTVPQVAGNTRKTIEELRCVYCSIGL